MSSSSQPGDDFEARSSDEENLYAALAILGERGNRYLIKWAGTDEHGKPWKNSWTPKHDVTPDLVEAWKAQKKKPGQEKAAAKSKARKQKNRASTESSRASTARPPVAGPSTSVRSLRSNSAVKDDDDYESISSGRNKRRATRPIPVHSDSDEAPPSPKRAKVANGRASTAKSPSNQTTPKPTNGSRGPHRSSSNSPPILRARTTMPPPPKPQLGPKIKVAVRKPQVLRDESPPSSDEPPKGPHPHRSKPVPNPLPPRFHSRGFVEQSQALAPGGDEQLEQFNRDMAQMPFQSQESDHENVAKRPLFLPGPSDEDEEDHYSPPPRRATSPPSPGARQNGSPTASEYLSPAPEPPRASTSRQTSIREDDFRVGDVPETQSTEGEDDAGPRGQKTPLRPGRATVKSKMKPRSPNSKSVATAAMPKALAPLPMYTHTQFKVRVDQAKSPTRSPDPFDDQHDSIETFSSPIKGKGKGKERQRDEDDEEDEALSRHVMERGMEMADAAASARRAEKAQYATRPNGVTLDQIAQLRQEEAQAQEDQSLTESDPHASQPTPGAVAVPKDILALREEEEESTQDIMLEFLNEEELAAGDKELELRNGGEDPHDEEIPASSEGERSYDMPEKIAFYAEQAEVLSQQQSQSQEVQEEDEDDSMGQLGYPGESPASKNPVPPAPNDVPPLPPPRLSRSRSNSPPAPESQPIIDLPPTASTQENSPAKGKAPVEDPEVRLEQAMQLLHQKSDEIRQLQKQLQDEQLTVITERARNAVLRDMINAESSAMVVDGGIGLDERLVAALAAKRQALADLAEAKTLQATLMSERDSARSSSADHAQRAQVFHEEYQRASAFGQEKAKEARELQSQLEITQKSLQNGVELVKETFAKREAVLTAEVVEWRNQARFLREQAVRTNDDDLRRRAAEHPELVAKVKTLNANIDDLRDQVDQLFLDLGAARDERDRANEEHEKLQREQTTVLPGDMLVYRCLWRSDETGPCTIFCPTKEALSEHAQMHAQLAGLVNSSQ